MDRHRINHTVKKITIAATAAFLLSSCITPVTPDPTDDGTVVSATIKPYTKADIDDDGLTVKWAGGDAIGVVSSENDNCKFAIVDSTTGRSTSKFISNSTLKGSVYSAYYPYSSSMEKMNLPSRQIQKGSGPDMSLLLCTAGKPSGSAQKGYSFTFSERWALLKFVIRTNDRLEGESLKSISLRVENMPVVANPAITGEYTLDLSDTKQAIRFTSCVDSVILDFEDSPVLKKNDSIVGWAFINPCKVSEEAMLFRIKTNRTSMLVDSYFTPAGGWTEGRRMIYDFDLAVMDESGELIYEGEAVPMDKQFLKLKEPGAYNMSGSNIRPIISHKKGYNQYSHYISSGIAYGGVTDVAAGTAFRAGVSSNIKEGGTGTIYTTAAALPEVSASDYSKVTCVKRSESAIYVVDNSNRIGYIIPIK